jgi:hypothetical protein
MTTDHMTEEIKKRKLVVPDVSMENDPVRKAQIIAESLKRQMGMLPTMSEQPVAATSGWPPPAPAATANTVR